MTHSNSAFYVNQLQPFVGRKISRVVTTPIDEWGQQYFGLRIGDKIIWFYSDDEGNNPGSFEIQDVSDPRYLDDYPGN